jgi:hypothetical protein
MDTDLERTKILVPVASRHLRLRFDPEAKSIEVGNADLAVRAFCRSDADARPRADCSSSRSSASAAEDHPAHFVSQTLDFFRVSGGSEAFGKVEEFLLLVLLGFNAVLDQFK